jgi:hypothetical protein
MDIRILLSTERSALDPDRPLLLYRAIFVSMEDGSVRNPRPDTYSNPAAGFADLAVTAQQDHGSTADGLPYGWSVEYRDVYSVNLERAEVMVKQLRKVNKGLADIEANLGYAETFGSYLARVGQVLRVSGYGWAIGSDGSGRWGYDGIEYHWTDARGLVTRVSQLAFEFNDKETA